MKRKTEKPGLKSNGGLALIGVWTTGLWMSSKLLESVQIYSTDTIVMFEKQFLIER